MTSLRPILVAFGLAISSGPTGAETVLPDLKPALSATASFLAVSGDGGLIPPHTPFKISVEINSHAAVTAPAGLDLYGWLRRVGPSDLPCTEAAEAYLRTGRLPVGAVFLNDPLVVMLTEDNSVVLVDPEFSLATANILAAKALATRPAEMSVDPVQRRVLISLPKEGRVIGIDAAGLVSELATDSGRPTAAIPAADGGIFVLDGDTDRVRRFPEGPAPDLRALGLVTSPDHPIAAIWNENEAALFDTETGDVTLALKGRSDAVMILSDNDHVLGLAVARDDILVLQYLDHDLTTEIKLGGPAKALALSYDGRFLFAYDPAGGPVSVVDLGLSRLLQTTIAGQTAISDVVVGDSAAYLMMADQSRVGVMDLISLARDGVAEFREVPLGAATKSHLTEPGLLTSLWPDRGVLAVHAGSRQAYRLHDYAAMGNAPAMTAINLRGGIPRRVVSLDRSFQEGPTGTFRTVTSLPGPGQWELVATTGLGALSFCTPIPVSDPGEAGPEAGTLLAVAAEPDGAIYLRMLDAKGEPAEVSGTVTFAALSGAWRHRVPLETDVNGLSRLVYELSPDDVVVLTVDVDSAAPFLPLLLEPSQ